MSSRKVAEDQPRLDGERETLRLWLRLLACATIIEKRLQRGLATRFSSSLTRFDILAALERNPEGMTMGDLSAALLVSNGNVTGRVQTLRRDGFVEVASPAADQRVSLVSLTATGRAHFLQMAGAHRGWVEELLGGFPAEERAELYDLLGELKRSLVRGDKGANE